MIANQRPMCALVASVSLGLVALVATGGMVVIVATGRDVPPGLSSIAGTAVGILGVAFLRVPSANGKGPDRSGPSPNDSSVPPG